MLRASKHESKQTNHVLCIQEQQPRQQKESLYVDFSFNKLVLFG